MAATRHLPADQEGRPARRSDRRGGSQVPRMRAGGRSRPDGLPALREARGRAVPAAGSGRRRLLLLAALGATLALALFALARQKASRTDCRGGERPTIEWRAPEGTV